MDIVAFAYLSVCMVIGLNANTTYVNKWLFKRQASNCSSSKNFVCSSGECLAKDLLCDSVVHCKDKSDESSALCQALYKGRCQKYQWRCAYGACVHQTRRCDQHQDCWDGSDEAGCSHASQSGGWPCEVPYPANNRTFNNWSKQLKQVAPGSFVEHNDQLLVSCDLGYDLNEMERDYNFTTCTNGTWSPRIPQCFTCGLSSLKVDVDVSTPLIEQDTQLGYFPWHAIVYSLKSDTWRVKCMGTLISATVVITTVHCVSNVTNANEVPTPLPLEVMRVRLGTNILDWNTTERQEQRFEIQELILHPDFHSGRKHFSNNFALIVLDREAEINAYVMPACVDYTGKYTEELANRKTRFGYVEEWLNNVVCGSNSNGQQCESKDWGTLLYDQLALLSRTSCYKEVEKLLRDAHRWLTGDMFCVNSSRPFSFSRASFLGSGLTVPVAGQHYFYGVSINWFGQLQTDNFYLGFSNVTDHIAWLAEEMKKFL